MHAINLAKKPHIINQGILMPVRRNIRIRAKVENLTNDVKVTLQLFEDDQPFKQEPNTQYVVPARVKQVFNYACFVTEAEEAQVI